MRMLTMFVSHRFRNDILGNDSSMDAKNKLDGPHETKYFEFENKCLGFNAHARSHDDLAKGTITSTLRH